MNVAVAAAGLIVGFVVGLTGMGGGALMTPILVLLFKVQPLAAVSSDLVASLIMKPVGAAVHARRGTVDRNLVKWLVIGSVPSAFVGVILLKNLGTGETVQHQIKIALGIALLVAASSMIAKARVDARRRARGEMIETSIAVRPVPTMLVGVLGGLVVGMTSVGSGSLIIVLLLLLYPGLTAGSLVGTDLVQAIPLVASAALGHVIFGDFRLGLTFSLLVGALPGVYIGARVSAKAPDKLIRPVLILVLLMSALKLLDVPTWTLGIVLGAGIALFGGLALRARSRRQSALPEPPAAVVPAAAAATTAP